MATAGEFIGMLFFERNVAHKAHLLTSSYAAHKALDDFYTGIIDLADSFAEAYQGAYDMLTDLQLSWVEPTDDIVEFLQGCVDWIQANRYIFVSKNDSAMQNIIDEVVTLHRSTLYKLTRLH